MSESNNVQSIVPTVHGLPDGAPGCDASAPPVGTHGEPGLEPGLPQVTSSASSCTTSPVGIQVVEAVTDPHRLARRFLDDRCRHSATSCGNQATGTGTPTLTFWQGSWLRWSAGAYRPLAGSELRAELTQTVKAEFDKLNQEAFTAWVSAGMVDKMGNPSSPPVALKVTRILIGDVDQALGGYSLLDGRTGPPAWLVVPPPFPAIEAIPFKNCVLHVPGWAGDRGQGLIGGTPVAVAPTPAFFSLHALDFDFDPTAPEPTAWLEFLHQLWDDDQESIGLIQEWFGLMLLPDASYQKILMLVGPKRSGKGTIARTLRALVGPENTCNPTLSSLGTQFGLAPLVGRLVAIITDARLSGRTDLAVVVENLLSVSGEDSKTIDRKFLQPLTTCLYSRFVVLTNELPRLADASGALASRMLILKLTRSFLGREDRGLTGKLLAELPGILNWALAGWGRLRERGHFVQPASGRAEMDLLEDLGSPVGEFVRECCVLGQEHSVAIAELYRSWQLWCADKGRLGVGDEHRFGRDLRAVLPALTVSQPRLPDGSRPRVYQGVGLRPVVGPPVVPARA